MSAMLHPSMSFNYELKVVVTAIAMYRNDAITTKCFSC